MTATFVDTSALIAFLVEEDQDHRAARSAAGSLMEEEARLLTTSYVLHESIALLQRRVGLRVLNEWRMTIEPLLEVIWIDADLHQRALTALLAANSRRVSLTDWASFEVMRSRDVRRAFTFDRDFRKHGFDTIP